MIYLATCPAFNKLKVMESYGNPLLGDIATETSLLIRVLIYF